MRYLHALSLGFLIVFSSCLRLRGGSESSSAGDPAGYDPLGGRSKCDVWGGHELNPLVVDWPAPKRAHLEAAAKRGTIVVRYSGCDFDVLAGCRVPDSTYEYTPLTRKTEQISITDEKLLYARLPFGAASLEGNLQGSGKLDINMTIVGQFDSDLYEAFGTTLEGDCTGATHIVRSLTVGAFEIKTSGSKTTGGGASAVTATAGVNESRTSGRNVLTADGDPSACATPHHSALSPPSNCGAPVQVVLAAISPNDPPPTSLTPQPQPASPPAPSPTQQQDVAPPPTISDVVAATLTQIAQLLTSSAQPPPNTACPPKSITIGGRCTHVNEYLVNVDSSHFPPRRVSYADCGNGYQWTGNSRDDAQQLGNLCGAPCGMIPAFRITSGTIPPNGLGTQAIPMQNDRCYRIITVGATGTDHLGTAITASNGTVLYQDNSPGPFSVIGRDAPFCPSETDWYRLYMASPAGNVSFHVLVLHGLRP